MTLDDKNKSMVCVVNASIFLSLEEQTELENRLSKHEVGLTFFERRGAQANLFKMLVVYLNAHLTELLVFGLLAPATYDALKTTFHYISKRITAFFRPGKIEELTPSMKLIIGKAEVIAPIPSNLSDEQFSVYMNTLQKTLKALADNEASKITKYDCFVVVRNGVTDLNVKTLAQYGMECAAKQHSAKGEQK